MSNYQLMARTLQETICKCGCGKVFKARFPRQAYATEGCSFRAKLAGEKRRIQSKKDREKVA